MCDSDFKPLSYQQNSVLRGNGQFDANFAEFPWQAMVVRESTKSLLCGGVIVDNNVVITTANCVQG